MIRVVDVIAALIAFVLGALEMRGAEVPISAQQVEAKFIAFRESIRSGIVEFELEQGSRVSKHRVVFGDGGFRGDNVLPNKDVGGEVRESFVFPAGSDVVMFYSDERFVKDGMLVGHVEEGPAAQFNGRWIYLLAGTIIGPATLCFILKRL